LSAERKEGGGTLMAEVFYLVSEATEDGYFWMHLKFFNTYDEAKNYIMHQDLKLGGKHRIKDFTRQQAKEAGLEEKWLECDLLKGEKL
jgi:hypothetical protein